MSTDSTDAVRTEGRGATPGPVRALVFDFDGLILDTETPILGIWQDIFRRHGQDLDVEDWQHALGTHGGFDPYARLAQLTGRPVDRKALAREVSERHWALCDDQPLLPGVAERVREGRDLGLGIAVASSSPSSWVEHWLQRHGLREAVDVVCGRDHVEKVKPAPDLFLLAAARLGVPPPACVAFEDSPNGIRAARAAGMRVVAVPNGITRRLRLPDPDCVIDSLADRTLGEILRILASRGRLQGAFSEEP